MNKPLFWKLLERFGVTGVQFILQIVLARLLAPELYGLLSIMIVFTTLANVFVQNGFNTSLVQNKDVEEDDYSSVLWVSLLVATVLYGVIFIAAPWIAAFYNNTILITPLRVLALMLFPGALNSVQLAKVNREMDFRKVFYSNVAGVVVSGGIGIYIALAGGGLWALVAQTLSNVVVVCIVMRFTVRLKIRFVCNLARIKVLFAFGWKLLVSSLIDTLYQDIRSLVVGKKYNEETLGYYDRGKQFPQFLINAVNGAVQSVMLPAMSRVQDERERVKAIMRRSVTLSAYIIFPIMAGLAAVATPLVTLLLTEKWLPCVPYLQVYCFTFAFYPVHSCNLQAINAIGRSDMFLKLEIIKKSYGLLALIIAVVFFHTPLAIALTGVFTAVLSCFVNAFPNRRLIGYSYTEQMKDLLPSFLAAGAMFLITWPLSFVALHPAILLLLQVALGVVAYLAISMLLCLEPFRFLLDFVKSKLHGRSAQSKAGEGQSE